MNEFDFRSKYIDIDEDDQKEKKVSNEEDLEIDFDDDNDDDDEITPKTKKGNNKHTVFVILAICAVVLIASLALGGYIVYRTSPAPQVTSVHIESNNFENPAEAKYGNMITLSFSFEKNLINQPIVIINNKRVEVYGEGKEFYAKYFVQLQGRTDQPVDFSIHDYRNMMRKTGPPITTTTDGSSVVIVAFK